MSTLEYVIWHIFGYAAMPFIILAGFTAVAIVCISILAMTKDKQLD